MTLSRDRGQTLATSESIIGHWTILSREIIIVSVNGHTHRISESVFRYTMPHLAIIEIRKTT